MRHGLSLLLLLAAGGVFGAGAERPVEIRSVAFNPHGEFPGAKGWLEQTNGVYALHYDFTAGGHGVGMPVTLREPIWAKRLSFEANHGLGHALGIVATDASGQCFFKFARRDAEGVWNRYVCEMGEGWLCHWNGPNDGVVRPPFRSFEVNLSRHRKGVPGPDEVGVTRVRNIGWTELPAGERGARASETNRVVYVMSDFRCGADRFSGGPRLFFRRGADYRSGGTAFENGCVTNDFARAERFELLNEIPVWGRPLAFRLTVEAPAEAAGLAFALGAAFGGHGSVPLGNLRAARAGERVIRQTFEVGAPGIGPWRHGARALNPKHRSKRIRSVTVMRGRAPAKTLAIRLVALEAVVAAGEDLPPLLATPPKGETPPRELEVGFLNLDAGGAGDRAVRVTLKDWQGRVLGKTVGRFPRTAAGARSFARVAVPSVAGSLDYVQYVCEALRDGVRDVRVPVWEASWTRPWTGEGTREKRPDVPWGFGVYIHRSEDRLAYASGYETPTNAAALAQMETRAALARKAGMKWERVELKPSQIEPVRGVYDFTSVDRVLEAADRNGLSYYIIGSHYWPGGYRPYTREAYAEWAKVLGMAVARYRNRCRHWEIWNEPNIDFWTGPKEDYIALCNAAYAEIRKADPRAVVIGCSTAGVDLPFMDRCRAGGMKFDAISIHPYRAEPEEEGFLADLAATTNRARGAKTYLTELGWPTGCDRNTYTERAQAGNFVRSYLTAAGSGTCVAINGYDFIDDGFNVLERENNFGILRRDLTPKPAYRALATLCTFFDRGAPTLERRVFSSARVAWIFRMGSKSAVWTTTRLRLAVRTDRATRAFDPMGETLSEGTAEHRVVTDPLSAVFFDGDIRDLEVLPSAPDREPEENVF